MDKKSEEKKWYDLRIKSPVSYKEAMSGIIGSAKKQKVIRKPNVRKEQLLEKKEKQMLEDIDIALEDMAKEEPKGDLPHNSMSGSVQSLVNKECLVDLDSNTGGKGSQSESIRGANEDEDLILKIIATFTEQITALKTDQRENYSALQNSMSLEFKALAAENKTLTAKLETTSMTLGVVKEETKRVNEEIIRVNARNGKLDAEVNDLRERLLKSKDREMELKEEINDVRVNNQSLALHMNAQKDIEDVKEKVTKEVINKLEEWRIEGTEENEGDQQVLDPNKWFNHLTQTNTEVKSILNFEENGNGSQNNNNSGNGGRDNEKRKAKKKKKPEKRRDNRKSRDNDDKDDDPSGSDSDESGDDANSSNSEEESNASSHSSQRGSHRRNKLSDNEKLRLLKDLPKITGIENFSASTNAEAWIEDFESKAIFAIMPRWAWPNQMGLKMSSLMSKTYRSFLETNEKLIDNEKNWWLKYKKRFIKKFAIAQNKSTAIIKLKSLDPKNFKTTDHYFDECLNLSQAIDDATGEVVGLEIIKHFPHLGIPLLGGDRCLLQQTPDKVIRDIRHCVLVDSQYNPKPIKERSNERSDNQNNNRFNFRKRGQNRGSYYNNVNSGGQSSNRSTPDNNQNTNNSNSQSNNQNTSQTYSRNSHQFPERKCFVCGSTQHIAHECPKNQSRPQSSGHNNRQPNGGQNGSGANRSVNFIDNAVPANEGKN